MEEKSSFRGHVDIYCTLLAQFKIVFTFENVRFVNEQLIFLFQTKCDIG